MTNSRLRYQLHSHRLRDPLADQCDQQFDGGVWNYLQDRICDYVADRIEHTLHAKAQLDEDHAEY